ncbi:MAG: adenylate/guanylate cyclase domain-containing protein [Sphaerospermopsis sp. SIO1G1]|nr:adenylate/guanylate cyclase domain-containing protein [Sphaerospermopsis sp. SIO1G1]
MKLFFVRSIYTQILTSTTLLIVALISAILAVWTSSESHAYRLDKINDARVISKVLSYTYSNEISQANWSQIRINLNLLMRENDEIVYVIISDHAQDNKIIAASPNELQDEYIPNIVPYHVTKKALESTEETTVIETYILRDILYNNKIRGKRGESVMEVSSEILRISGTKLGKLRIGISLKQVEDAVNRAIYKALVMGFLGLNFGWICSYILARELSDTVRHLQTSVTKIAKGDLQQRVETKHLPDEIYSLANSVNQMSSALEISFTQLQKTLASFERFVPDKFVSVIAPLGMENIEVGMASTRKMTILFCDIRGYTSMSEAMAPMEIFSFLNDYLACMGQAIDETGGFIDKYIGDAIMALFDDESTDSALNAAIAMQKSLDKFNNLRLQKNLPNISVGIGIHRGTVVMGTVGFTSRMDSTVIGDAVNVASRIEELTKQYNCEILITESVVNNLSDPESFSLRLVNESVKVKGKDKPIAIYELKVTHQL